MQPHAGPAAPDGAPTVHTGRLFVFYWRWLTSVTVGVLLFGVTMVLAPGAMSRGLGLLMFASPDAISAFEGHAVAYITLAHGVLGAAIIGWSVALLFVLLGPFRRGSREAWLTYAVSMAAWFVPDTALSLWIGLWQNAVLNSVFALAVAIPLAATYQPRQTSSSTLR